MIDYRGPRGGARLSTMPATESARPAELLFATELAWRARALQRTLKWAGNKQVRV